MSQILIPDKAPGDPYPASEWNTVKDAINDNDSRVTNLEASFPYKFETILIAESFNDQEPSIVDDTIQIELGSAQGTGGDPVQVDALGEITFNEAMTVTLAVSAEYGRAGGAGISELRLRAVINGTPQPPVLSAKLDDQDVRVPFQAVLELNAAVGMTFTFEIVRDPSGNNSGGLFAATSTAAGWADSPSARVVINRFIAI